MYRFAVPASEDFEIQYYVEIVEDMDWVCLAPNRKVWKTPLNVVMSLHVVYEAGKYVANGATITVKFVKNIFCEFESCSEVNLLDAVIILMLSKMVLIDPFFMS